MRRGSFVCIFYNFFVPCSVHGDSTGTESNVRLLDRGRGITSQLYSRLFLSELLADYSRANILKALQHCKNIASLQQGKKLAAPYSIAKILEPTVHTHIAPKPITGDRRKKRNGMLCAHRGARTVWLKVIPMLDSDYNAFDVYYCTYPTTTSLKGLRC